MPSLKQQLSQLKGSGVILWLNHPEFKTLNGKLTDIETDHVTVAADNHAYIVLHNAIVALRATGQGTDQGRDEGEARLGKAR